MSEGWLSISGLHHTIAMRQILRSMKERKHLKVVRKRSARPDSEYVVCWSRLPIPIHIYLLM